MRCGGFYLVPAALLGNTAAGSAVGLVSIAARRKHVLVSEIFRVLHLCSEENKNESMIHATHAVLPFFAIESKSSGRSGFRGVVLRSVANGIESFLGDIWLIP